MPTGEKNFVKRVMDRSSSVTKISIRLASLICPMTILSVRGQAG
jgi:hypothetical protein